MVFSGFATGTAHSSHAGYGPPFGIVPGERQSRLSGETAIRSMGLFHLLLIASTAAAAFVVSSLAESSGPEPLDGYLVYLKSDQKLSDIEFKKSDAIVVRPRLLQLKEDGKKLSAEIEFRATKNNSPTGPVSKGWIDLDQLSTTKPLEKTNMKAWTMEPPKAEPPPPPAPAPQTPATPEPTPAPPISELPQNPLPQDPTPCDIAMGCHTAAQVQTPVRGPLVSLDRAKMVRIITEFHDSAFCSNVNAKVDTDGSSRRDLFLKAWDDFIASKSGRACDRASKDEDCDSFNRARELDFITRTATFEAEPPSKKYPAEQTKIRSRCELDLILLTLRNRAYDPMCAKYKPGLKPTKFGCLFEGDIVGVSSKPSELNIWTDLDTLNTRVTGCFLRGDADTIVWKDKGGRKSFMDRREQFKFTLSRALRVLDPGIPLENQFDIDSTARTINATEKKSLIANTRFYYHPIGMGKCEPETFDKTVFVGLGYAKSETDTYLLMSTRFVPKVVNGKTTIGTVYNMESPLQPLARADFALMVAGSVVPDKFLDRKHVNKCWPPLENTACTVDQSLGYRKAPKWAISKGNETYKISCRADEAVGDSAAELTWTWNGLCDPGLVVTPEFMN